MTDNRRRAARARLLQRGRIVLNAGFTVVECVVTEISSGGAKLKLPSTVGIPDEFELRVGTHRQRNVEVRHRGSDSLGVMFLD